MIRKVQYNPILSPKHELKTQNNSPHKFVKNFNSGVIFIDEHNNYKRKEEKASYWFHKYLQDLQKRGISQKIVKHF